MQRSSTRDNGQPGPAREAAVEETQLSPGLCDDDDGIDDDEETQLRHSPGSDDDHGGGKEESIGEFSEHTPPPMLMPPVPFDAHPRRATCLSYFKGGMIHNHELCGGCRGRLHNRWTRCQRNLCTARS